jgi:hypothetical protein
MHPALKILFGFVFIALGLGLFVDSIMPTSITGVQWVSNFIIVFTGIIPPFLIMIGLFVVWLEIDELKVQKEIKEEEKKGKEKEKEKDKEKEKKK